MATHEQYETLIAKIASLQSELTHVRSTSHWFRFEYVFLVVLIGVTGAYAYKKCKLIHARANFVWVPPVYGSRTCSRCSGPGYHCHSCSRTQSNAWNCTSCSGKGIIGYELSTCKTYSYQRKCQVCLGRGWDSDPCNYCASGSNIPRCLNCSGRGTESTGQNYYTPIPSARITFLSNEALLKVLLFVSGILVILSIGLLQQQGGGLMNVAIAIATIYAAIGGWRYVMVQWDAVFWTHVALASVYVARVGLLVLELMQTPSESPIGWLRGSSLICLLAITVTCREMYDT